jgi:hypothetical protein
VPTGPASNIGEYVYEFEYASLPEIIMELQALKLPTLTTAVCFGPLRLRVPRDLVLRRRRAYPRCGRELARSRGFAKFVARVVQRTAPDAGGAQEASSF